MSLVLRSEKPAMKDVDPWEREKKPLELGTLDAQHPGCHISGRMGRLMYEVGGYKTECPTPHICVLRCREEYVNPGEGPSECGC